MQRTLDANERKTFQDIAIDYAKRRMKKLEEEEEKDTGAPLATRRVKTSVIPLQQKRKYSLSNGENEGNSESSTTTDFPLSLPKSKQRSPGNENVIPGKKYSFSHSRSCERTPTNSNETATSNTNSPRTPMSKNTFNKENPRPTTSGNADNKKSPRTPLSRNVLSLMDAHVTETPKVQRKRQTKTKKPSQESMLQKWVTPLNKQKFKDKLDTVFQHSPRSLKYPDSDSDEDCIIEDTSPTSSTSKSVNSTSKGKRLGAAPTNRFGSVEGGSSVSSWDQQRQVQCPLCSGM